MRKRLIPGQKWACMGLLALGLGGALAPQALTPQASADPLVKTEDCAWLVAARPAAMENSKTWGLIYDEILADNPEVVQNRQAMVDMLGVDVFDSLESVYVFSKDANSQTLQLVADLNSTLGNLEGALLAVPGYSSTMFEDKILIHALPMDAPNHKTAYVGMVPVDEGKRHVILASTDESVLKQMVLEVWGGGDATAPGGLLDGRLLAARVYTMPSVDQMDPMQQGVIGMVNGMGFDLVDTGEGLAASLQVTAVDPARANQIVQLVNTGRGFLAHSAKQDPNVQSLAVFLQGLGVRSDAATVHVDWRVSATDLVEQLKKMAEQAH